MTELAARLMARAALTNAPNTPVSAEEVAHVLELELAHVREHVPRGCQEGHAPWSSWLISLGYEASHAAGGETTVEPLTTWQAVAKAIGVSYATVVRRRREVGHEGRPYFDDGEGARDWWRQLTTPTAPTAETLSQATAPVDRRASRPRCASPRGSWW